MRMKFKNLHAVSGLKTRALAVLMMAGGLSFAAQAYASGSESEPFNGKSVRDAVTAVAADPVKVEGVVVDENGQPVIGATIIVSGKGTGAITDANGKFSFNAEIGAEYTASYLGMRDYTGKVKSAAPIKITMETNATKLDDVVVVGYNQMARRDVSAAVTSVDMSAISDIPVASITDLLSGQAAGVQSVMRGNAPGQAGGGLVIRGNTNLSNADDATGLSNPLYIIDGIPMSLADFAGYNVTQNDFLATLNPNEIKSIDVLKDAAATAIYGSRGANGVIIIQTKRGMKGDPRFSASVNVGVNFEPKFYDVYIGEAERQYKTGEIKQALTNLFGEQAWIDIRSDRQFEVEGYLWPAALTDKYNPSFNNAYDFQDMFYRPGVTQDYNASIEGGDEKSSYRIGLGYYTEKAVVEGTGYSRLTFNTALVNDLSKHVHNDLSIRFSFQDRKGGIMDMSDKMRALPTDPTQLPSSLYYLSESELARMSGELGDSYNKNKSYNLSVSEALRITIIDGLVWDNQFSASLNMGFSDYFIPSTARDENMNYARSASSLGSSITYHSVLSYNKNIKEIHDITALVGFELNNELNKYSQIDAEDSGSDDLHVIQGFKKEMIDGKTDRVVSNMLSYFAQFSYTLKKRYQIEATIRRDGSSRFGQDNKWATFPSVKAHWVFSREPWMEATSNWLDFAKLRISFGTSGSIADNPLLQYNSLVQLPGYGAGLYSFNTNKMDVKGYGGNGGVVSDFTRVANRSLSWAKSKEINYGIDLELFKSRLYITADIYSRYIKGQIFTTELPPYVGFTSLESNLVDMISNGFEIAINGYLFPRTSKFQWEWTLNLAKNTTTIAKMGNRGRDIIQDGYAFVQGERAFQFYMKEYLGPLQSFDDLPVNPYTGKAMVYQSSDAGLALNYQGRIFPGMPVFTDADGDYQLYAWYGDSGDSKIIAGKSPEPKITGGLHTTLKYKGWQLRVNSSFAFGGYIYNTSLENMLSVYDSMNNYLHRASYDLEDVDFWQAPGDDAYYPMVYIAYTDGGSARAFQSSSMYLEKNNYWSIDNITLSYTFPTDMIAKIGLKGLSLSAQMQNVAIMKSSKVQDPRVITKTGRYNGDGFPIQRKMTFGLQFKF